jgi:hypothetical protein
MDFVMNVRLWKTFAECFDCLHVDNILCMLGALSPEFTSSKNIVFRRSFVTCHFATNCYLGWWQSQNFDLK